MMVLDDDGAGSSGGTVRGGQDSSSAVLSGKGESGEDEEYGGEYEDEEEEASSRDLNLPYMSWEDFAGVIDPSMDFDRLAEFWFPPAREVTMGRPWARWTLHRDVKGRVTGISTGSERRERRSYPRRGRKEEEGTLKKAEENRLAGRKVRLFSAAENSRREVCSRWSVTDSILVAWEIDPVH